MKEETKVNYAKQYQNNFPEFDLDSVYYIVEINSEKFDKYWNKKAYINENFMTASQCTRIPTYTKLLNEIQTNPNHQIAYPIISWVNEKNIKMSQGRHRIRAIIDSEAETIQIAVKEKDFDILKGQVDIIKVIDKLVF